MAGILTNRDDVAQIVSSSSTDGIDRNHSKVATFELSDYLHNAKPIDASSVRDLIRAFAYAIVLGNRFGVRLPDGTIMTIE
jgi:hypothetical protein